MEGLTLTKLFAQIESKLDTKQFALPRKSTTYALTYLLHTTLSALENGSCSVMIRELENLGVHPAIVRWIKAFLSNREQCVRIENSYSSWKKTNGGLPQGTKLGPLLFAVLVNSLLKDWPGRVKFVDGTTALEIIPRCSPSFLPIVVDQISDYANERGMRSKEMQRYGYYVS
jgi:hypothetical protein